MVFSLSCNSGVSKIWTSESSKKMVIYNIKQIFLLSNFEHLDITTCEKNVNISMLKLEEFKKLVYKIVVLHISKVSFHL